MLTTAQICFIALLGTIVCYGQRAATEGSVGVVLNEWCPSHKSDSKQSEKVKQFAREICDEKCKPYHEVYGNCSVPACISNSSIYYHNARHPVVTPLKILTSQHSKLISPFAPEHSCKKMHLLHMRIRSTNENYNKTGASGKQTPDNGKSFEFDDTAFKFDFREQFLSHTTNALFSQNMNLL